MSGYVQEQPPAKHKFRQVCDRGTSCPQRQDQAHLAAYAHPLDPDYCAMCSTWDRQPESASLKGLFAWLDVDASGRLSRKELECAVPLLSRLRSEDFDITEDAWDALDEDGNGVVNFSEFAQWAGPRFGLPLGVAHLFNNAFPCGVLGCPCEGYRPSRRFESDSSGSEEESDAESSHKKKDKKDKKYKKEKKDKKDKKDKKEKKNKKDKKEKKRPKDWERELSHTSDRTVARFAPCMCGHKNMAHGGHSSAAERQEVPYPTYWDNQISGSSIERDVNVLVELGIDRHAQFQQFLDATYSDRWTRDRGKHSPEEPNVPKRFRVRKVYRNENSRNWREYCVRRAEMEMDRLDLGATKSFVEYSNVRSAMAWESIFGPHRLSPVCNEWYLFHGTSTEVARLICSGSFKMSMAGGHTGTLYGRGTYCCESITKADEYTQPDDNNERAVIICRALGGRVRYTDEVVPPDQEDLVTSCIEGPYDSVLGDRERCRGTYREFVFFDAENLYAEYVVTYVREF